MDTDAVRNDPFRVSRPARRRVSLRRSITVLSSLVALAAVIVTAFAVAAYRQADEVQHARRAHLIPAVDAANGLASAAVDQETGLRGYVLTGDPAFLEPYERGVTRQETAEAALMVALSDEYPDIAALVVPVEETLDVWRTEIAEPEIELVREGRPGEAIELVANGRGKQVFDELRGHLERLDAAIEAERNASRADLVRRVDRLYRVALGAAAVAVLAAIGMWLLARRRVTRPLDQLAREATAVADGVRDTRITEGGSIEIDAVATSVERMRLQLLGEITRAYSSGMVQAEEAERARLAGELHDDPIQVLTSAQWQLEALAATLPVDHQASAASIARSLAEVQARLRTLMFRLHPPGLDDEGLLAALDDLLLDAFDGTDVELQLTVELPDDLAPAISTLVFRIAAEAIRNVRKHAAARTVNVWVRGTGDGVQLSVIDDGIGADLQGLPAGHHGISISRALAAAAGGWWHVHSRPGRGTTVTCWLPLAGAVGEREPGSTGR